MIIAGFKGLKTVATAAPPTSCAGWGCVLYACVHCLYACRRSIHTVITQLAIDCIVLCASAAVESPHSDKG